MNEVAFKKEDGRLVFELSGRIDSGNASQVEAEIMKIRDSEPHEGITIDCDKLLYMSSAGLRILLRLRKDDKTLLVVNASSELYEIFEMTGFTEMMEIRKAYRRVETEGCEIIGEGANGIVYRIDRDTIVKAYRNPDALPDIKRERELARKALILGVPTAIPYDVVRIGDGYGSMFELLNAKSLAQILKADPSKLDEVVEKNVALLKTIHGTVVEPGDMPDMKETVVKWTRFLGDHLEKATYEKLLSLVEAIPEDHHMLHGDYHLKNVMEQNGETLLIDMDTLSVGYPIFEFGFMYNAYLGYSEVNHEEVKEFLGIDRELSGQVFYRSLEAYLGTDDKEKVNQVADKAALIGHIRMLRYYIRRIGMETEYGRAHIENSRSRIERLLTGIDSLTF